MNKITSSFVLASVALTFTVALSACSKTQEQFDFSKKSPDEFAVVKRAPLEMPPDYGLRPPRPGLQRPQELQTDKEAKQAIFGMEKTQTKTEPMTDGESILLRKSGAISIDPDIRYKIDSETAAIAKKEMPTVDRILGKIGKKVDAPATVVDPIKESERIIHNKEAGKPVTDGKTPTIEQ